MKDGLVCLVWQDNSIDRNLGKARQAKALMTLINTASIKPMSNHPLEKLSLQNS
jgi:hypothetical protein